MSQPQALGWLGRDRLAVIAGVAAPLALAAILVPFRTNFANTDAALAMILLVVAVAAVGNRLAGYVAALSAAAWFDFFLTRPYERVRDQPGDRHRDDSLAAGHRRRRHRDRGLGPPSARQRQQAGRLPGGHQRRGPRGRDRRLAVHADRRDRGVPDPAALPALVPVPVRSRGHWQAGPAASTTARSPSMACRTTSVTADLPAGTSLELLVESGGRLRGRFLDAAGARCPADARAADGRGRAG